MTVAAIDIGTNSMRLLITTDTGEELDRQLAVTGLGTGVDATGRFDDDRVRATLAALAVFGDAMQSHDVTMSAAVATSASRDAVNGPEFIVAASERLGVTPRVISGEREASLSFAGAMRDRDVSPHVVIDIGGGSTEFIAGTTDVADSVSIDMGSVRLTDRRLDRRPVSQDGLADARAMVAEAFLGVPDADGATVVGVAGTFTSLAAMSLDLSTYDRSAVDGTVLHSSVVDGLVETLAGMSLDETAKIPSLHPQRARVILGGAIIASEAMAAVGADRIEVSESDLLDGLAAELRAGRRHTPR